MPERRKPNKAKSTWHATKRRAQKKKKTSHLSRHAPVGAEHARRLAGATGAEEEPEAIEGVSHVERLPVRRRIHRPPALDGLVRGRVDQNHPHVREEEKAHPQVVVRLCTGQADTGQHRGMVAVRQSRRGRESKEA